ncbi:MAG: thermonuclease family protein [Chloroflexi bacterium]|nr:thermonuclease family protein [Chloroflexota bacterium]
MRKLGPPTAPTTAVLVITAAILALFVLAACDDETPPQDTPGATQTAATTAPTASLPPPSFPDGTTPALVVRVVDGDTIEVEVDGETYKVRYIGIDTPETVDPRRPVGCFGEEASAANKALVEGLIVGLEGDVSDTDRFGRLLRYVWLNSQEMVNAILVRDGYAQASAYPPDVRYQELFDGLEAGARSAGRGLWGPVCLETSAPTPAGSPAEGACDYSGTSEAVIKGNISTNSGEKIYHVPGGGFYEQTVIDEAAGERWFCAESDAVAAGWRISLR